MRSGAHSFLSFPIKVTLMIPVYNELDHLETFLAQVDRASFGIPKKLVFVDDCSSDGSRELLER